MCMENEEYPRYCKGKSKNRRVEIEPPPRSTNPLSAEVRIALQAAARGMPNARCTIPAGPGRAVELDRCDELGIPYPLFDLRIA